MNNMKKITMVAIIGASLMLGGCGTAKKSVVEIKANEIAFGINNFSDKNEKDGGDSSQKFDNTREFWQSVRQTQKMVTVPYERISTGAIPFINSIVIPKQKIIVVSQSPVIRDWVQDSSRGTSSIDQSFKAESSQGAEFSLGIVASAKISSPELYLSIYGTSLDAKLTDVKVEAIPLETVMDRTIKAFIQGELSAEFSKFSTGEIQSRKNEVISKVAELTKERFLKDGITLLTFNGSDNLTWSDSAIQKSINDTARLLADKEKEQAQQIVERTQAETRRIAKEQDDLANARKREIEASTKQKEAEYSRLTQAEVNKQQLEKAENDRLIALSNAKKDTEVANEKSKVINAEKQLLELEIKRTELEVMKKEAEAKLLRASKWNGKESYSELQIQGASSIVDKNGEVKTLNLVK